MPTIGPLESIIVMLICFLSVIPILAIVALIIWLIQRNNATRTITVPKDATVTVNVNPPPAPPTPSTPKDTSTDQNT